MRAEVVSGNLSVLLITHKFREVQAFADEVTILRKGKLAGQGLTNELSVDQMAQMMLGKARVQQSVVKASIEQQRPVQQIENVQAEGENGLVAITDINLTVRTGEIVGIAGVSGNGQKELVEVLSGQRSHTAGQLKVNGEIYTATRAEMYHHQVYALPEEPLRNACVPTMSVAENMALRTFDRTPQAKWNWLLLLNAIKKSAQKLVQTFSVRTPSVETPVSNLSGGNVQRTVLARELSSDSVQLLIAANPCFGLDFSAGEFIHEALVAARNRGVAILLVSEDLDELLALCDRIFVISEGKLVYESDIHHADLTLIGQKMAGQ
ncbi:MAG: ATP-binding cassette domain-containing protein [Phormidesmis sp.]